MLECEMFSPMQKHLKNLGYKVYTEFAFFSKVVDIVAFDDREKIAIEMKLSLTKKVILQANTNKLLADYSYVFVPTNPKQTSIKSCKDKGIGIYRLTKEGEIIELLPAAKNIVTGYPATRYTLDGLSEGTEAGYPTRKIKGGKE